MKKILNFFQKGVDKSRAMWYNVTSEREEENPITSESENKMMTLDERIVWVQDMGWDYEVFETMNDELCLQAWEGTHTMHEWAYTKDGKQVDKECIYTC